MSAPHPGVCNRIRGTPAAEDEKTEWYFASSINYNTHAEMALRVTAVHCIVKDGSMLAEAFVIKIKDAGLQCIGLL